MTKKVSPNFDRASLAELGNQPGVVLLRPHSLDAIEEGGDYDFLELGGWELGREIEEKFGRPIVKIERTYVHQRFYHWGQIDVLPSLEWNGFQYADAGKLIAEAAADSEGVRRLQLGHDAVVSWLTSLLWGGFYKEKYDPLITRAAHEDRDRMHDTLAWALGEAWAGELMTWAGEGMAAESSKHVAALRRSLKWRAFKREGGAVMKSVGRHWYRELQHHLSPKLPLIAFLGPDGSGKSSVIEGVTQKLGKMGLRQRMMHWRPYGIKGREVGQGAPVINPHSEPPRGLITSVAKLGMLWLDWWVPYLTVMLHARAKTSVVISDRYYNDLLVDPIRYRYGASRRLAAFAFGFYPKPDLVFVLTGSAEVIHPRKKEVSLKELKGQLTRYESLARSLGDSAVLLDVDQPLDEVIEKSWEHTLTLLSGKKVEREKLSQIRSQKTLRVAQFVPHYPSLEGLTAYCRGLSKEMNKLVPASCPIITLREELKHVGGDEELLHYPISSRNPMSLPPDLIADLESARHELDGIVLHGPYHPRIAMLRRHLQRIGIPYIFVPHDPYVPELTRHHAVRKFVFWHLFEKYTIANAEAVQILAPEHEKPLRKLGFTVPVEEIPNGCELDALKELPAKVKVPGRAKRVRIQYVGRMDRNHKGLDLLIQAFAEYVIEEKMKEIELVLTGNDWEDRRELEGLAAKTGAGDQIIFTGPRPEHSLAIHSEADLVVLPSRFDGFGLTIVEAMLASRPVLLSSQAGAASHVRKAGGGWIFQPVVAEIKEAIAKAMRERHRWEKMGKDNYQYVTTQLTWEQTARKTMTMYQRYFR